MLIIGILSLALVSCANEESETSLSYDQQRIVDSLYSVELPSLRKKIDSLCLESKNKNWDNLVDSVLEIRLIEVEQLIYD